jgi:hypothetical protein
LHAFFDTGVDVLWRTWNVPRRAVPKELAIKVPSGIVFMRGLR